MKKSVLLLSCLFVISATLWLMAHSRTPVRWPPSFKTSSRQCEPPVPALPGTGFFFTDSFSGIL